ncbi:MAG: collagen binding domain-containing protein [Elusimicrobiota bacterium]
MKNTIWKKFCAPIFSIAILTPALIGPARVFAQIEEAAPRTDWSSPVGAASAASMPSQISALPQGLSGSLSVNPAAITETLETPPRVPALETAVEKAAAQTPEKFPATIPVSPRSSAIASSIKAARNANATSESLKAQKTARLTPAAASAETADVKKQTILSKLTAFVAHGVALSRPIFDGQGLTRSETLGRPSAVSFDIIRRKHKSQILLPPGVTLTEKTEPLAGQGGPVSINKFYLSPNHALEDGSRPIALAANAADMSAVEQALRNLVDADPAEYGATNSQDMAAVHVERLPGTGRQADSIIATFRQVKQGQDIDGSPYFLAVEGANLRFHIKIIGGKPVIMAVEGGFVPGIDPSAMTVNFTDQQLDQAAAKQIGLPSGQSSRLQFLTRELTYINNSWRAVNIYESSDLNGNSIIVIVDVNSGQAYAVNPDDMRYGKIPAVGADFARAAGRQTESGAPAIGEATARGTTLTPDGQDHGPTGPMPLANAYVYDDAGQVAAVTDENGRFTIPQTANGGKPVRVTIKLSGIYGQVFDDDSKDAPIAATLTVTPGQSVTMTLNPSGDNTQLDADVNAYVYPYKMIGWLKSTLNLGGDARFFAPLRNGIHANGTAMVANAFYDPTTDAFYLMKSGSIQENATPAAPQSLAYRAWSRMTRIIRGKAMTITLVAENTAQPSIELHEFGHRQYQVASQIRLSADQAASASYRFIKWLIDPIIGSEANEAGADTFSMLIRNSPIIGNGFFLSASPESAMPNPNIIRDGENKTQYDVSDNPSDDPHQQGETQMGTAWMSYQDMIPEMGQAVALQYAAKLFIRTWLYVQPGNAVNALLHSIIADMAEDGTIPHADIIISHAKNDHGLTLPTPQATPAS